jgi:hypothetical protein
MWEEKMEQKLFRQKSLERITSPEQLDDYLHVTSPAVWAVLLGVILLLSGFFFWCSVTAVESYVTGTAEARNGIITITFDDENSAQRIEEGMNVRIGKYSAPVLSEGEDENGRYQAIANLDIPDGQYEVKVDYRKTQIARIFFN